MSNPFDQFDDAPNAPASASPQGNANPFDQFDPDPAAIHTFRTTAPDGKEVRFTAPANAPDDQIRQLAAKAAGSRRYLRSEIKRGDNVDAAPQHTAAESFGIGVRDVLTGAAGIGDIVAGPLNAATNYVTGSHLSNQPFKGAASYISDLAGLPKAETGSEQVISAINQGAAGALVPVAGASGALARGGGAVARALAERPILQVATGAVGSGAGEGTRQAGGSPLAQGLATVGASIATGGAGVASLPRIGGLAPEEANAAKILLKKLADQGMTPAEAAQIMDQAGARGVPLALMDTGDETRGLASALARKPGASRTIIRDVIIPRQEGQLDRVQGSIQRDLGPTANVRAQSERLIQGARDAAKPLYDKFEAGPAITTPELDSLLATPAGRSAISRAMTIAANERRDPKALGFSLDENGDVKLNPVDISPFQAEGEARDAFQKAQEAHKLALRTAGSDTDATRNALADARDRMEQATKDVANRKTAGVAETTRGYTPTTLDYVKRGLDDVIESHRDPVTGRLKMDESLRAINKVNREFIREMDSLHPDYAPARQAYAGPARMATALAKGAKFNSRDAETIWAETRDMTAPELEQYKLGVRSTLSKALGDKGDYADKVKALVGTPNKRAALEHLFGGSEKFDNFMATLADEQAAAATHSRLMGSQTAANLADDGNLDGLTGVALNAGVRAIKGQGIVHNAIQSVGDALQYGSGKAGERVRAQLAAGLSETDPAALRLAISKAQAARTQLRVIPQSGVLGALSQIQQPTAKGPKVSASVARLIAP